ncbi:MAG: FHA domain-containing protein, partial [Thermoanaerobaculia bacterium]
MAENPSQPKLERPVPVVVHLSGKLRGTTERLSGDRLRIGTAAEAEVHFPADREPAVAESHAHLTRSGETYALHAEPGQRVWVNGERADTVELRSGDVLEIGPSGPTLRFRLYEPGGDA